MLFSMCLNYNAVEFINTVFGLGPMVLIGNFMKGDSGLFVSS